MKRSLIFIVLVLSCYCFALSAESTAAPRRIVSLAPSTTEILFALGLGDNIAGVTTFCDYPEEAKKKPKIGGMSNPSLEAILTMKPDLVVMTTDGNPKDIEERLHVLHIRTYVFTARRLFQLPQAIRDMGAVLQVQERAGTLAQEIDSALKKAEAKGKTRGTVGPTKKVLFIVWPEPLIVAGPGTVMDDAIALLGHENIAHGAMASYPKYSLEEVIRIAPDAIFIGKGSGMDMREVSKGMLERMASVPAVKNKAVFYLSDNLYRLGPRVVQGIEELSACLP
jgi:iron complex transport system substrate-binding protein